MRFRPLSLAALAAAAVLSTAGAASAQEYADLKVQFVYDSDDLPEKEAVDMSKDAFCVKIHEGNPVHRDVMQVDPATRGIANVAIYPDRRSGIDEKDVHPDLLKETEPPVLDNIECMFAPHVITMTAGNKIIVKNSDETGHNAAFAFFENDSVNKIIPQGGSEEFEVEKAERGPIPVECSIHPWMKAYLIVQELPYMGVSDAEGKLTIEKLPAGKEISLKVWHENANKSIEKVNIGGKDTELKRGVLEITLKPGMNDLGVIKIKPDQFK